VHVLLATDGSDIALDAAARGLAVLAEPTKVTLLSVIADVAADAGAGGIEGPIYTPEQEEELRKSEQRNASRELADTEKVVRRVRPNATIAQMVETGDPAAVICLVASDLGVDVVLVGSHGKGFLSRVLLGSVSEHVARHAPCPVLVVRPHEAARDRS
jgi:nucleotide-binding universal stress UspA family protein